TRYTADTMRVLKNRFPAARLVWVMGADSLATFHLWKSWRQIAELVPIAVISRPGHGLAALTSPAAKKLERYRWSVQDARSLPGAQTPAWVYLPAVHNPLSSTEIRDKRRS
ncbi:MAG: nicotinic acid mononucleotide adenylyltransferase, partial [Pseudomonadota bacterium]